MFKRTLWLTSALSAATLVAGAAHAAAAGVAPTDTAADQGGGTVIGELVVTAEKREQSLQTVPIAISAFTAKQRDIQGIQTIQDMTNFTPGLVYSSQLDRTAIRGIGRLSNLLTADAAVAVYSDDFFTTSTTEAGRDTLFVDRVEVLRGPQGTLYGRNAIGGAINIISKRPTATPYAEARVTVANYNAQQYEAAISGPVTDWLGVRLAGYDTEQKGGYFKNLFPGLPDEGGVTHNWYVEGQFNAKLGDRAEWWVKAFVAGAHDTRGGPGSLLFTPTTGAYDTALLSPYDGLTFNPGFGYSTQFGQVDPTTGLALGPVAGSVTGGCGVTQNPAITNIRNFCHNTKTQIDLRSTYAVDSHFIYHFDGFDVKYVVGYDQYKYKLSQDWDSLGVDSYTIPLNPAGSTCAFVNANHIANCAPLTVYPTEILNYPENNRWMSHELTFSSTGNGPIQWIGGLYYFDEHYSNPVTIATDPRQVQLLGQLGGIAVNPTPEPDFALYSAAYNMETKSEAVYGQVDWKVTDAIKLTGGLRYTYDQKQGDEFYRLILMNNTAGNPSDLGTLLPAIDVTPFVAAGAGVVPQSVRGVSSPTTLLPDGKWTRSLKDHSHAVTGTAGVEWTPDSDTLAYLRYSRGYKAFAFNAGTIALSDEAAPEFIDAYEMGVKKTFNHNLVIDGAIFHYDYHNAQIPIGVNVGGTIQSEFFNLKSARSDGLELAALWAPIDHLNLSLTYSYDDTSVRSGCTLVAGVATGACFVDAADPQGLLPGAKPVGPLVPTSTGLQQPQSVKGGPLPQAPKNKVALNANYTFVLDPGNLTLSGSFVWKDVSYASVFRRAAESAPSWNQVDLRATWAGRNDKYEVAAYIKNVFNSQGYDAAGAGVPLSYGTATAYDLTPPRLYGVELRYKFF